MAKNCNQPVDYMAGIWGGGAAEPESGNKNLDISADSPPQATFSSSSPKVKSPLCRTAQPVSWTLDKATAQQYLITVMQGSGEILH